MGTSRKPFPQAHPSLSGYNRSPQGPTVLWEKSKCLQRQKEPYNLPNKTEEATLILINAWKTLLFQKHGGIKCEKHFQILPCKKKQNQTGKHQVL